MFWVAVDLRAAIEAYENGRSEIGRYHFAGISG